MDIDKDLKIKIDININIRMDIDTGIFDTNRSTDIGIGIPNEMRIGAGSLLLV